MRLKFTKDSNNKWYVVLPEWEGSPEDLEMVCGADTMLDILAKGNFEVTLNISETPFENATLELHFDREENGGAWYNLKSEFFNFEVWLCYVTTFVFGSLPKTIYLSR